MRRAALALFLAAVLVPVAHAHGSDLPISPPELWHHWNFDPWIWAPLLLGHWLYGRGLARARARDRRIIPAWHAASFFAGEVVLVVALISPLDPLGETLLAAHMAQHILLTAVAPLLLVLGLPVRAWVWGLPKGWRSLGASPAARVFVKAFDALTHPVTATLLHGAVIWLWHVPAWFDAALETPWLHVLEHISFLATALMFWSAVLRRQTRAASAALAVAVTFLHSGMLGGLLTLAPSPLYGWYGARPWLWGLGGLEDQQVAGLLMWVAAGAIYLSAFAVLALRILEPASASGSPRGRSMGIMRASTSSRSMK